MNALEIITMAFKAEAKAKPDKFVIIPETKQKIPYPEFSKMLDVYPKKNNNYVKSLIPTLEKMFHDSPAFRSKMMTLAGVTTWQP